MKANASPITAKEVLIEARSWNLAITPRQAESILLRNRGKISRAMKNAAREVVQEEVANYLFAVEEKELFRR